MSISIPGLPPLSWTGEAGEAVVDGDHLTLVSAARVDWFNSPWAGTRLHSATGLVGTPPVGPFALSARVGVTGTRSTFDAGVLCLWAGPDRWAKLCFELSPAGRPMVVSVVTDGWSDDSNAHVVEAPDVHLRVSRGDHGFAFHASTDAETWEFIRTFRLPDPELIKVGFLVQSPTGPPCTATFSAITLLDRAPADLRDGS